MNVQTSPPVPLEDVEYPENDGKPMAENTTQYRWIVTIQGNFERLFRDQADVFVAGDLLWYPVEGDPTTCTAPDTMIVFGRPKGDRSSYMQWLEDGIAPQVVWEVLSPGNRPGEIREKLEFYQRYGVEEYYQYDPDRGDLRGWLRDGEELRPIQSIQGWISPRTGVRMSLAGTELALHYPDGKSFLTFGEWVALQEQAASRADRLAAQLRALGIEPEA
jgi:Uma2 family endonuclease